MKNVRLLLIGVTVLVAVLLVGLAVALNSSFQTWAARRMIASRPDLRVTVGRVAAGFNRVRITDLTYERDGVKLTVPRLDAELGVVAAALRQRYDVSTLEVAGWRVDRVRAAVNPPPAGTPPTASATVRGPTGSTPAPVAPTPAFQGIFPFLDLPVDVSVGKLTASGTVVEGDASAKVDITGGDFGVGHEGRLVVTAHVVRPGAEVQSLTVRSEVAATMDSPRTFDRLRVSSDATAEGSVLAQPVTLHGELDARRAGREEHYAINLTQASRSLAVVDAQFAEGGAQVTGTWKLDLRDADVAPFALGRALPRFVVTGGGALDADAAFTAVHASGALDATVDNLTALAASLAGVGGVKLKAGVDVALRSDVLSVSKVDVAIATRAPAATAAEPTEKFVGTVRALQAFTFNARTRELTATSPEKDLVGVALAGVPLAWARPFLPSVTLGGSDLRGELTATPRGGGFHFQSRVPLTISRLTVANAGQPLLRELDVSLGLTGDYTPRGWQAELTGLTARSGAATILLLDAKAGQLAGADQAIKATGLITADLAALLAEPVLKNRVALKRGEASIEFAASFAETKQLQANIGIKNLQGSQATAPADALPTITATLRADLTPDGRVTIKAPLTLVRAGRESDIAIVGTFGAPTSSFDAQVTSNHFVIRDAKALADLLPAAPATPTVATTGEQAPAWAQWNGAVALQLRHVVYPGTFEMKNVTGTLHVSGGTVKFQDVHAGVGEAGQAQANGAVTFNAAAVSPFSLGANLALTEFDPGPFLLAINPHQLPTVEGRFAITTKVRSNARTFAGLAEAATGKFELTSKAGIFRGLPVNVGNLVENSSKLVAWLATAGDVIASPFIGRKDQDEITSRSQAANELAKILSNIPYDQLGIVVAQDDGTQALVKEFTLISPELRINGNGTARRVPGSPRLDQLVELNLRVRARGRPAELMKYLGILDPKPDDLGYAACTIPVRVEGPLDRLDATQLNNRLVALAVAKTGLTEKAVDWINRLRGKGPN